MFDFGVLEALVAGSPYRIMVWQVCCGRAVEKLFFRAYRETDGIGNA